MKCFPIVPENICWQFLSGILLGACMTAFAVPAADEGTVRNRLRLDTSRHGYAINTQSREAQQHFDQGLLLAYGFNHAEAARSFREAQRIDPECAMCFWGEALVLGPNINAPMENSAIAPAWQALTRAVSLKDSARPSAQALIEALQQRYRKKPPQDRSSLDRAYMDAMREVSRRFPKDVVIRSLFAESIMDLHPWDYWSREGQPREWTPELVETLETALQQNTDNPLANHLYIHTMESSPHPEKALPSARRLPALVPESGHLVHMPAHIYIRVGKYREAADANRAAVKIDRDYLQHEHADSIYTQAYVPHNYHFLWAAASKSGQSALATRAAAETATRVNPEMMREPGLGGTLQHFYLTPLFTEALFGQWQRILTYPEPAADLLYPRAIRHYARGLALLRNADPAKAREELEQLQRIVDDPSIENLTIFDLNPVKKVLQIAAAILHGEIEFAAGNTEQAIALLRQAARLEDSLNYTEPKDWYLPPRQVLGAMLLESGDPAAAESAYRKDLEFHPNSGWSLLGLQQSLAAQNKTAEAEDTGKLFRQAWTDADIELTSSRF